MSMNWEPDCEYRIGALEGLAVVVVVVLAYAVAALVVYGGLRLLGVL